MILTITLLIIKISILKAQEECICISKIENKKEEYVLCAPKKPGYCSFKNGFYPNISTSNLQLYFVKNSNLLAFNKLNRKPNKLTIQYSDMKEMICTRDYGNIYIDLSYNQITKLENKDCQSTEIVTFNLSHNMILFIKNDYFIKMVSLQNLDLTHNNLKTIGLRFLLNVEKMNLLLGFNRNLSHINWISFTKYEKNIFSKLFGSKIYKTTSITINTQNTSIIGFPSINLNENIETLLFSTHFYNIGFDFSYRRNNPNQNTIECVNNCSSLNERLFDQTSIINYIWEIDSLNLVKSGFHSLPNLKYVNLKVI